MPKLLLIVFLLVSAVAQATTSHAGPYRDYVERLNTSPPGGSMYRPDLEATLLALANAYRAEEGKEPLAADPTFVAAARAHAADMMTHSTLR